MRACHKRERCCSAFAADSYQVNNGQTAVIDEHGICRVVTNNSGNSLFVPTRTSAEWTAFNKPTAKRSVATVRQLRA